MIKNHIKIAFRNLFKNKLTSTINILGLAAGISISILIGLWVFDELSANKEQENYNTIVQVLKHSYSSSDGTIGTGDSNPIPLATELRDSYADSFEKVALSTRNTSLPLTYDGQSFTHIGRFMENGAPEMLALKMIHGTRQNFYNTDVIFLSKSLAEKLFNDKVPLDKTIVLDGNTSLTIKGVYNDFPNNSTFKDVDFIAPFYTYAAMNEWVLNEQENWHSNSFLLYAQINANTTVEKVSVRVKDVLLQHISEERATKNKPQLFLHPMSKWQLFSAFENGKNITSEELKLIWTYSIIGIFILILACVNFINLSTAQSEKRAKEVGIKKTLGSSRKKLINQFLLESLSVALLAFFIAMIFTQLGIGFFSEITNKSLSIPWTSSYFWLSGIAFTIVTGILAGIYPAFYLSNFRPTAVLKNTFTLKKSSILSRQTLVVFQFVITIVLISGAIIIYQQVSHIKNRPLGYNQNGLVSIPIKNKISGKENLLREQLLNSGLITEVTTSTSELTDIFSNHTGFDWNNENIRDRENINFGVIGIDPYYGKTIGWEFTDGRDFTEYSSEDRNGIIINQAAQKALGYKNPIGKFVQSNYLHRGKNFKILGVVKDMVMKSPHGENKPVFFFLSKTKLWAIVKINPRANPHLAVETVKTVLKDVDPTIPFEYRFVDDEYALKFANEERVMKMISMSSILAIFISCMGLFGLASFIVEKRKKEIGIRKVLGQRNLKINFLLSKQLLKLIIIAILIGTPLAYYLLNEWLVDFNYRINIRISHFMLSAAGAITIALLTVAFQTIRAISRNPIDALREE